MQVIYDGVTYTYIATIWATTKTMFIVYDASGNVHEIQALKCTVV